MSNWWTLDQALFWVATRDSELVSAADARPRRSTRADRLAWVHFILGDEEGGLPGEMHMPPDEAADKLLDAIADGGVAAKFSSSAAEAAEPSWFDNAAIEYETRGDDCVARLRWKGRDTLPISMPDQAYVVVSIDDLRRVFPDMIGELERVDQQHAAATHNESKGAAAIEPVQQDQHAEATSPQTNYRRRGPPSYRAHDAQFFPEIERLLQSGEAMSVKRAAEMAVAGGRLKGAGTEENKARRLALHYHQHKDRQTKL